MAINEILKKYPNIKGFEVHGLSIIAETGNQQINAQCVACESKKMFINPESKLWDCKKCGENGNFEDFLAHVHTRNLSDVSIQKLRKLSKLRGGLQTKTLKAFGTGYSKGSGEFTNPTYRQKAGKSIRLICDIPRYSVDKNISYATRGATSGLIMPNKVYDSGTVWICEGLWDAEAWWEVLHAQGIHDDVVGLRGASNFPIQWLSFFRNKNVMLLFDNDDPGQKGMQRTWNLLGGSAKTLARLDWPHDTPDKFDVRDIYQQMNEHDTEETYKMVYGLLKKSLPDVQVATGIAQTMETEKKSHVIDESGKGLTRGAVVKAYRKWLHLQDTQVLDVLYGSVFANRIEADPLWLFLIAEPGGSKSELLMSMSAAPLIYATTTLTPNALISGANFAGGGDPSLLPKVLGKTMVVKDFTTILDMLQHEKDVIFSILRDAYDGHIKKEYGNGVVREYVGKFGLLAGVTPVIDSSEHATGALGERFLKYRIRLPGKVNKGNDIIRKALSNLMSEDTMRDELKEIGTAALNRPIPKPYPKLNQKYINKIIDLAQWVSNMRGTVVRGRYHQQQLANKPSTEIGTRLAKQLATLGVGIAIFQGKKAIDDDIFLILARVARDTAPGIVEEILKQIYVHCYDDLATVNDLNEWSKFPKETCRYHLEDLALLNVLKQKKVDRSDAWRINRPMLRMIDKIGMYSMEATFRKTIQTHKRAAPKRKVKAKPTRKEGKK